MKNIKWSFLPLFSVILSIMLFPGSVKESKALDVNRVNLEHVLTKEEINASGKLTIQKLSKVVQKFKPKYPDIIIAQAIEESGHFKSDLFVNHGNLFGMKKSGARPTVACYITKNGYAGYCGDKVMMSVTDRILLDAAFYRGLSREQYFKKLADTYASNPSYVPNLKKIIKENNLL